MVHNKYKWNFSFHCGKRLSLGNFNNQTRASSYKWLRNSATGYSNITTVLDMKVKKKQRMVYLVTSSVHRIDMHILLCIHMLLVYDANCFWQNGQFIMFLNSGGNCGQF